MMLSNILAGTMLFGSLAFRTPNVQPNPDDYEVSIGFTNDNYYANRQWERELGTKYIDDLFWIKIEDGILKLLKNIHMWKNAPVWDAKKIKIVTKDADIKL